MKGFQLVTYKWSKSTIIIPHPTWLALLKLSYSKYHINLYYISRKKKNSGTFQMNVKVTDFSLVILETLINCDILVKTRKPNSSKTSKWMTISAYNPLRFILSQQVPCLDSYCDPAIWSEDFCSHWQSIRFWIQSYL